MSSGLSSWFRGIKGKILFASILPIIGFVVIFLLAFSSFQKLEAYLNTSNKDMIPNLQAIGEMRQARNKFGYQVLAAMNMPTAEKRLERLVIVRGAIKEFQESFKLYMSIPSPAELDPTDKEGQNALDEYISLMNKSADLVETGKSENYDEVKRQLDGRLWELGKVMNKMTTAALKVYSEVSATNSKNAEESIRTSKTLMLATTGLISLLTLGLLLTLASKVSATVGKIAGQLKEANDRVASSVEQLNAAGNSLSQSSTEAAASLEETVASLEELTSMVQMNSDNARQAATLSASSRDAAEKGEHEIQSLIKSMTEISQSSKKIEEIISVIDDIAFQTNLLALNAAVEAARAGEQGKGFAVVAEAVRALAQRSASAAKDITGLIKDSVSQIERGSHTADQSGTVLTNIVTSVKKVSDLNNEIAAASSEQTAGIQQISKAMNQLDQASQSNAASAEEIAATSGEINNLANTAQSLTIELNHAVLGQNTRENSNGNTSSPAHSLKKTKTSPSPTEKTASPSKASAPTKKIAEAKPAAADSSQNVIPFDEDERSSIGTTKGF